MSTFCRTFGATDATVFPKQYASKSRLNDILLKDSAPQQVAVLYEKGLLRRDVKYLTPSQVGGQVGGLVGGPVGGKESHATDPGEKKGVHKFKNRPGKSTPSAVRGSMGAEKSNVPDKGVGASKIPDLFLSIVETDAGQQTPMLATSLSTIACYLCSIGAYAAFPSASKAVKRAHKAIKGMMETQPTSEHSTTFQAGRGDKKRTFTMMKHAEEPLGMSTINIEDVKEYSAQHRQLEREKKSRRADVDSDSDMEYEANY